MEDGWMDHLIPPVKCLLFLNIGFISRWLSPAYPPSCQQSYLVFPKIRRKICCLSSVMSDSIFSRKPASTVSLLLPSTVAVINRVPLLPWPTTLLGLSLGLTHPKTTLRAEWLSVIGRLSFTASALTEIHHWEWGASVGSMHSQMEPPVQILAP